MGDEIKSQEMLGANVYIRDYDDEKHVNNLEVKFCLPLKMKISRSGEAYSTRLSVV